MGSCYVDKSFEASDNVTLKKNFDLYIEDKRFEDGHGAYNGVLRHSISITSQVFKTGREAHDFISEKTDKFGPAIAVQVGDFKKAFFNTANGKKLIAKVEELRAKTSGFDAALLKKLATQKSLFKGCSHCGSKISIKHYIKGNSTKCPVCHKEFVKSDREVATLNKLYNELNAKEKELYTARIAHKQKMGDKAPYWYVGGWASE